MGEVVGWAENEAIGADPVATLWFGRDATDLNTVTDIPLSADGGFSCAATMVS